MSQQGSSASAHDTAERIAANWGWHDRTILTLGKARAYDDLILRFPLPFEKKIRQYSKKRSLNLGWVYALVRAESAFMEDARMADPEGRSVLHVATIVEMQTRI